MLRPKLRARNPMLPVLSLLSACTVAFVPPPPPQVMFSLRSTADAHAAAYASPRCRCRNLPRSRSRYSPQRVQRPLLRAGADGQEGGAEDGDGDGGDVAGAGMGLDGAWQVKSGQGKRARVDAVGAIPGQLPEKTRDGQDWAEWAKEWREDPQGKADRLVAQWDKESKDSGRSKKRKSKNKRKGKGGPSRGVVGSGFGGAMRPTKSVPEGLVVSETGAGNGDIVDWSSGQQLTQTDRKDNMAADWQQDARHLESLDPSDREKLAEKLRMALGKKQKTKRKAPSPRGDSKGFSNDDSAAIGSSPPKIRGDGRGALASAAVAAGASAAKDVAGVTIFPAASATAGVVADGNTEREGSRFGDKGGESGRGGDALVGEGGSESQGKGRVTMAAAAGVGSDGEESNDSSGSGATAVGIKVEGARGYERLAPPARVDGTERTGRKIPLDRAMGFGRGAAVVDDVAQGGESDDALVSSSLPEAEVGAAKGSPNGEGTLSGMSKFGRGVSIVVGPEVEDEGAAAVSAKKNRRQNTSSADERVSGFGRGVAFPVERDADKI